MSLTKEQLSVPVSLRTEDQEAISKLERVSKKERLEEPDKVLVEFEAFGSINSISSADGKDMDPDTLKAAIEGAVELSRALASEKGGELGKDLGLREALDDPG